MNAAPLFLFFSKYYLEILILPELEFNYNSTFPFLYFTYSCDTLTLMFLIICIVIVNDWETATLKLYIKYFLYFYKIFK